MAYQSFTDVLNELEAKTIIDLAALPPTETLQDTEAEQYRSALCLLAQVRAELQQCYIEPKTIYRAVAKAQIYTLRRVPKTGVVEYLQGVSEASAKLLLKADSMARQRR